MEPANALTPLQVSEITKAFSLCDTDGNGEIDASELANVMRHISGIEPSEEDVQRLLVAVDKDQSGTVSLTEFLEAVGEWLSDAETDSKRFKTSSAEEEKKELHHQIKGFFQQFRKAADYEEVRQKISDANEGVVGMDTGDNWFGFRSEGQTSTQKLEFLQHFHMLSAELDSILTGLNATSIDRLNALANMEKLLSITEVFARPSERSAVADDLAQLFEVLVRCNLPEMLVNILQTSGDGLSQVSALRCLTLFVPGPRVPSTPESSLMHPKAMYFKRMAISSDAPLVASRFLNFNAPATCEQAVAFVAAMVKDDWEIRDFYLQNHILSLLTPLVLDSTPSNILGLTAQAIASLCGVSHKGNPLPSWQQIQPSFTPLGHMLFSDDSQILCNVLSAFTLTLPGVRPDFAIIARILELINAFPDPKVVQYALQVAAHVAKFDAIQTNSFLTRGLLDSLKVALTSSSAPVRSTAMDVLETLAKTRQVFQPIVDAGFLDVIGEMMTTDESLRVRIVRLLLTFSELTPLARVMGSRGAFIPHLCGALSWFKEYDNVIFESYAVEGPMFNYELITDVVNAIGNLIADGEAVKAISGHTINTYATQFDGDCIERIQDVLAALSEVAAAGAETWRRTREGQGKSIDSALFSILHQVRSSVEAATTFQMNAQVRQVVLDRIAAIMDGYYQSSSHEEEFQASQSQASQSAQILVKCYFPDDIRLLEVSKNISYEDLIALIAAKYGRTLNVSYIDADGDPVRLDHGSMAIAFGSSENAMNTSAATVKLMLTDKTNALVSSAAAAAAYQAVPRSPDEDEDAAGIPSKKRSRTGSQIVHSASSSSVPVAFGGSVVFAKALGLDLEGGADLMKDEFAAMKLVQRNQNFSHIRSSTKFGDKELESLYVQWTQNSPSGQVGRQQFEEGMKSIGVTDPLVIEQNFNAFDVDKDGQIDFREFVVSLSTILTGSDEDRMKFMFRSYDADNSGNLSPEEVFNIFRASMAINGTVASDEELMKTVTSVFAEIDLDGNGEISFDEFRLAVESGKLPVSLAFSVMQ